MQISLQKVELKSPRIDLMRGLFKPRQEWLKEVVIDSVDALDDTKRVAPTDGVEIVEWMQLSFGDSAVLEGLEKDYSACSTGTAGKPRIVSANGDGFIPGVRLNGRFGTIGGYNYYGSKVLEQGYLPVETKYGYFRIPVRRGEGGWYKGEKWAGGKTVHGYKDLLVFGCVPWCGTHQINVVLAVFDSIAKAPVTKRVRFASFYGLSCPLFFNVATRIPSPVCVMRIGITSDREQKIKIKGRGTEGVYHKVYFEDEFEVDKGENEVIYNVTGFPVVGEFTLELQPENNTKTVLDYLYVYP